MFAFGMFYLLFCIYGIITCILSFNFLIKSKEYYVGEKITLTIFLFLSIFLMSCCLYLT